MRIPPSEEPPERDAGIRATVLHASLAGSAEGVVLRVHVTGDAWIRRYGCAAPAQAAWAWRGVPDRELEDWVARSVEAAGPERAIVRLRALDEMPTVRAVLDVLQAALGIRGVESVDVGLRERGYQRLDASESGLQWLANRQLPDGSWSGAEWGRWCAAQPMVERLDSDGSADADVGTTGSALCAFLGAGYTNRGDHPFAKTVSRGLKWLKSVQNADGTFSPALRDHAWASLAMIEAYGMTESVLWRAPASRALSAGYPSLPDAGRDPVASTLVALVLASARLIDADARSRGRSSPWTVTETAIDVVVRRLESIDTGRGDVATAGSLFGRLILTRDRQGLADRIEALPLPGSERADFHPAYAWFGTRALPPNAPVWKAWTDALRPLLDEARTGPACCYGGSWDVPPSVLLPGGRVEATALFLLASQALHRGYHDALTSR